MSAWPWKAARDSRPTRSSCSIRACVRRASAPVLSSPSSSKRSPASAFLRSRTRLKPVPAATPYDANIALFCAKHNSVSACQQANVRHSSSARKQETQSNNSPGRAAFCHVLQKASCNRSRIQ